MPKQFSREEKMSDAFLVFGSQYYVHARYSAQIPYLPVSVALLHHAIEMLLKGYLCKRKTSSKLKKIGHNLEVLWDLFKAETADTTLARFDQTIHHLDMVELLRYPDSIVDDGFALHVSLGSPSLPFHIPGTENLPQYYVNIDDLDAIVSEVFKVCEVEATPYFKDAPTELKKYLPFALLPMEYR